MKSPRRPSDVDARVASRPKPGPAKGAKALQGDRGGPRGPDGVLREPCAGYARLLVRQSGRREGIHPQGVAFRRRWPSAQFRFRRALHADHAGRRLRVRSSSCAQGAIDPGRLHSDARPFGAHFGRRPRAPTTLGRSVAVGGNANVETSGSGNRPASPMGGAMARQVTGAAGSRRCTQRTGSGGPSAERRPRALLGRAARRTARGGSAQLIA